jgi:hypothetical protein
MSNAGSTVAENRVSNTTRTAEGKTGSENTVVDETISRNGIKCNYSSCDRRLGIGYIAKAIKDKKGVTLMVLCSERCFKNSSYAKFLLDKK